MGRSYSSVIALVCLVFCSTAKAQSTYRIWLTGWTPECSKTVTTALLDLDPDGQVKVNRTTHTAELVSTVQLTPGAFEQVLAPHGLGVLFVTKNNPEGGQAPLDPEGISFPVLRDTGDPEQDNADYDEAKAAWIAAHPELYAAYKAGFFVNAPEE